MAQRLVLNPDDFYADLRQLIVDDWGRTLHGDPEEKFAEARRILEGRGSPAKKLSDLDDLLETHGVEALPPSGQEVAFEYLNTGKTYDPTIIYSYKDDKFFVGDWGSAFEEWESEEIDDAWDSWIRQDVEQDVRDGIESDDSLSESEADEAVEYLDMYGSDELKVKFYDALSEVGGEVTTESDGSVFVYRQAAAVERLRKEIVKEALTPTHMENARSGGQLGGEDFIKELKRAVTVDRHVVATPPGAPSRVVHGLPNTGQLYVNFYNLPTSAAAGGARGENNRSLFVVKGFGASGPNDPPPSGKVRVEQLTSAFPREYRLRARTGTPEKIAAYLADFINRVATEVAPKYSP